MVEIGNHVYICDVSGFVYDGTLKSVSENGEECEVSCGSLDCSVTGVVGIFETEREAEECRRRIFRENPEVEERYKKHQRKFKEVADKLLMASCNIKEWEV